jgi:hypothetical protein
LKLLQAFAFIIFSCSASLAQSVPAAPREVNASLTITGSLPKILKEASGLEITYSGLLWTHNDDRFPILYGLNASGSIERVIHLNHLNKGWEDLTKDEDGNLYIGAFGNNMNNRKDLSVLKIPDPESVTAEIINAEVIEFSYPDQRDFPPADGKKNFDADAMVALRDSLFIFTKNRTEPFTGYSKVYRLPSTPGRHEALLYDSIFLGAGSMMRNSVTSADISPDGKRLALLSHDSIWLISDFHNTRFSQGTIVKINLGNFSHKTGICFVSDTMIYLVDELELGFLGGKIYSLDLKSISPQSTPGN